MIIFLLCLSILLNVTCLLWCASLTGTIGRAMSLIYSLRDHFHRMQDKVNRVYPPRW